MKLNRRPLTDLVADVLQLDGHAAPSLPTTAVVSLAQSGGVHGSVVTVDPRRIVVGLDVRAASLPDRQRILDALKARLHRGLLELTTDDQPGRVLHVTCERVEVELYSGAYAIPTVFVRCTFVAPDPVRTDAEPHVLGLSAAPTACPIGTETVAPRVWLYGASPSVVNPVVIVRDHTGTEVMRLTLTVTLATNDALVIDAGAQTLDRYVAGVLQTGTSAGLGALTSGRFPLLDPSDANADAEAWGTIAVSAASGTPTGLLTYNRRW
jgi:hypothetical protein